MAFLQKISNILVAGTLSFILELLWLHSSCWVCRGRGVAFIHPLYQGSVRSSGLHIKEVEMITFVEQTSRASDQMPKINSIESTCVISSLNLMFDCLLESSGSDDSNKWSNIGFDEETDIIEIKICAFSQVPYRLVSRV